MPFRGTFRFDLYIPCVQLSEPPGPLFSEAFSNYSTSIFRLDAAGLYQQVSVLLAGDGDLLQRFAEFLPQEYQKPSSGVKEAVTGMTQLSLLNTWLNLVSSSKKFSLKVRHTLYNNPF